MKNIRKYLIPWMVMSIMACVDDKGNYDYVSITEVLPFEMVVEQAGKPVGDEIDYRIGTLLDLSLQLEGEVDTMDYSFVWFAVRQGIGGATRDTLSTTSKVQVSLDYDPGNYQLYVEAHKKHTEVYKSVTFPMSVTTIMSKGWYLLKDKGGKCDFDFITAEGEVLSDVIAGTGAEPLNGAARSVAYMPSRYTYTYTDESGKEISEANKRALFVLSEKEMRILNADNNGAFHVQGDCFYEPLQEYDFGCIKFCGNAVYLTNAGYSHSLTTSSPNVGRLGWAKDPTAGYRIYPEILVGNYSSLYWDINTSTFLQLGTYDVVYSKFPEQATGKEPSVSPTNMGKELVRLLPRKDCETTATAMALLKDETGAYFLAEISIAFTGAYPFTSYKELPADLYFPRADVMAAHREAAAVYFAKGNEVWKYIHADEVPEREVTTGISFPGEEISYIQQMEDFLLIVTYKEEKWKMYRFQLIGDTSDVQTEPMEEPYEGNGYVRKVFFRS